MLFFSSCSTNKSVVGLYGKCAKRYFACTQIELKSDKTFEYFIFYDVGGGNIIKGNWNKLSKDTYVLNTLSQPQIQETTYKAKTNPKLKGKIKIRISDKSGALAYSSIFINDSKQSKQADSTGVAEFDSQKIEYIKFGYLGKYEIIQINNPNYNDIEILSRDLDLGVVPQFLTDHKIIIKGRKLIMDSDYVFPKTNYNNKQWN